MAYDKKWIVEVLRHLGYEHEADEAERTLPSEVSEEEMTQFGDRHGISRDDLTNRMGGSP